MDAMPGPGETTGERSAMAPAFKRLWSDERGEDLVEYGLLVAFAAAVVTAALIQDPVGWKPALVSAFTKVKTALNLN